MKKKHNKQIWLNWKSAGFLALIIWLFPFVTAQAWETGQQEQPQHAVPIYVYNAQYAQVYKTRAQVIYEVKQRYAGRVLKVNFDKKSSMYYVRILTPRGKIRVIPVNAVAQ